MALARLRQDEGPGVLDHGRRRARVFIFALHELPVNPIHVLDGAPFQHHGLRFREPVPRRSTRRDRGCETWCRRTSGGEMRVGRTITASGVAVAILASASGAALQAWGAQGHRIAGLIAAAHLTPTARQNVAWLLPDSSLA